MTSLDIHPASTGRPDPTAVSTVLAAAFLDDPVFRWLVPDPEELASIIEPMFELYVGAFARHEETHLQHRDGQPAGAALWAPPGAAPIHPDDEPAFLERAAELAGANLGRLEQCLERFEAVHPHDPAWYLQFLGVTPDHQGQGIGSQLLRRVLDRADAVGEAAFLEATSLQNRALYERHGFRVIADIELPDGPTAFAMWRDPR